MGRDDTFGNIDCWRFDISTQLADLTFCARCCCCSVFCCLFHISIDELMSCVFIVLFVPWFLVVLDVFFSSLICFDAFSHSNWIECFVLNSYDLQQSHRFCSYYMISVRNSMLLQKPHKSALSTMMWITTCMMCYKQTSVRVGRIKKKEVASYCEKRFAIAYSE